MIRDEDSRLEVVRDDGQRHAAKVAECIFETTDEILGGLSPDDLGVAPSREAEDYSEEMRATSLSVRETDRCPLAKVDLGFFSWGALHPPER